MQDTNLNGDKYPESINLERKNIKGFILTKAIWRNYYGDSREIGVRNSSDYKDFKLIQGRMCNRKNSLIIIEKLLLKGRSVEYCQKFFNWAEERG